MKPIAHRVVVSRLLLLLLLLFPLIVSVFGRLGRVAAQGSSGLVAAYAFEEGTGSTAADLSGQGNVGMIAGATWTPGKYGNALSFNGTSAHVTVNDSASLRLTTGMTLEAWVFPTTVSSAWRDVIYKGNDNYFLEGTSANGGLPAMGGTFAGELYGTAPLSVNTWTHLAATYDGTTMRLYVNGVQVSSRPQSGNIATSANPLQIGGDSIFGQHWSGRIDEVRVYNRALLASEIQTDMDSPLTEALPDLTPPAVSITFPGVGGMVSHVTAVAATATDNVEVVNVEIFVDGASVGLDSTAPYAVGWDTTTANNGNHTITAVARDLSGNSTTSTPVAVTTLNPAFVNEIVVPDIADAATIVFLPDGRMLVGRLSESILVVQPGAHVPDPVPFLQLPDSSLLIGEQGLMDIVLDPDFVSNGHYYIFYTRGSPGSSNHNRVSRFTASGNGTVSGSELVLWQDDLVAEQEHHGGTLAFGQDGKLYITYGDQFIPENSQRLDTYRGKVLRINSDGSVPTDNPFFDGNGPNKDQIWAYGLRNPFRMSVDSVTDRMYIGDVGGNDASTAIEEINVGARGANYGWPLVEGVTSLSGITNPIHSYPHFGRDGCVVGGFVYRGNQFPGEYYGSYFFGDYVQNTIKRLTFDANGNVAAVVNFWPADGSVDGSTVGDPIKLIEGPDGSLYYVDLGFNDQHIPNPAAIRRIRYVAANAPPVAVATATPAAGQPPLTVNFSSAGSFDPEGQSLTFNWTFGDGTSSTEVNPTHVYANAGSYIARMTASDGVNTSLASDLNIVVGNPPTPTILSPTNGTMFRAGDVINFSGAATDPDDPLPASAFSWTIVFHHEGHLHPAAGPIVGMSGTFTIPTSGHDFQGQTSYEITLTVTDSTGLSGARSATIFPEKVNLTFDTVPSGLTLIINGISKQTPFVLDELIGFQDTISAPNQSSGEVPYSFVSWSDGGTQTHGIVAPTLNESYVATFQASTFIGTRSFSNPSGIAIPNEGTATPYPSTTVLAGMGGTISKVTATLIGVNHTNPDDLDVLLVSPGGQKVLLVSDAGGSGDLNSVTLTLDDAAATTLSNNGQLTSGTFRPSNYDTNTDTFQSPAPTGPYASTLSAFNGQAANGVWSLFVRDDRTGGQGSFAGGWSLTITTVAPTLPANGLVAAYGFNEGSGTTVADASGTNNSGTISGPTWTTSGKYGNALSFNGTNALITINDSASLRLTTGMTLEAWVFPTTVSGVWRDVIYKGNDNYYLEGTSDTGGVPAMGGTFGGTLYGTGALPANAWTHLAATYDGTTMRLYVNGVQVSSRAQTGNIATSANPLQIGGDSIYGQFWAGLIDEVRVYNRALNAPEIQTDMNAPIP